MKYFKVKNSVGVSCYVDTFIIKPYFHRVGFCLLVSLFGTEAEVKSVLADFVQSRENKLIMNESVYSFERYYNGKYAVVKQKLRTENGRKFLNAIVYNKDLFKNGKLIVADSEKELKSAVINYFDRNFPTVPIPETVKESVVFHYLKEGEGIYFSKDIQDVEIEEVNSSSNYLLTSGLDNKKVAFVEIDPYLNANDVRETIKEFMLKKTA